MQKKEFSTNIIEQIYSHPFVIARKIKKGEIIFLEGEVCNEITFIKSGTIYAKNMFFSGKEHIAKVLSAGELMGILLINSTAPYYKASFYTQTSCEILSLDKNHFLALLFSNPSIMKEYLRLLSDAYNQLNDHLKLLSCKNLRNQLSHLIYVWSNKLQCKQFDFPLNQTELAQYLRVERPSVSREIKKMVTDGIILFQRNHCIILDPNQLEVEL